MTWRMIWFALGICATVLCIVNSWPWWLTAINVAIDLWNLLGLIAAASRGRS